MLELLLYILGVAAIVASVAFLLPMVVYVCVRSGTAGYLITKQRFLKLKKDECDECERSKNRENLGGSAKS